MGVFYPANYRREPEIEQNSYLVASRLGKKSCLVIAVDSSLLEAFLPGDD